jgi:hypothetical protein
VTRSHSALLVAVQAQCDAAETENVPVAGPSPKDASLGEISIVQAPRPSCTTETDCPATVNVPVRALSDELAVRLTFTTPLPVPLAPLVIDIQPLLETADHVQWLAVVTFTEPGPPEAANDSDVVERVKAHGPGVGSVGDFVPQPARAAATEKSALKTHADGFRITDSAERSSATTAPVHIS